MSTINTGDFFVGAANNIYHFDVSGTYIETYSEPNGYNVLGLTVSSIGHVYALIEVSSFSIYDIYHFDDTFTFVEALTSQINDPTFHTVAEDITIRITNNNILLATWLYDPSYNTVDMQIWELDYPSGTVLNQFTGLDQDGAPWNSFRTSSYYTDTPAKLIIDCDDTTIYYTTLPPSFERINNTSHVFRYDRATATQLTPFATRPNFDQYKHGSLSLLSPGKVVVTLTSPAANSSAGPVYGDAVVSSSSLYADELEIGSGSFFRIHEFGAVAGVVGSDFALPDSGIPTRCMASYYNPCTVITTTPFPIIVTLIGAT